MSGQKEQRENTATEHVLMANYGVLSGSNHCTEENIHPQTDTKRRKWKRQWEEFSQNTTIHGLKQIAESTDTPLRRYIWLILLLTGTSLFLYQMVENVRYHRSWPTTVNVVVNYNHTLRFPAITICNQNAFRMSVAHENDWYWPLSHLYSQSNLSHISSNFTNLSMEYVYRKAAHNLRDLIISCQWEKQPCSWQNFSTVFTDNGVCFSFNTDFRSPLKVTQSGAEYGLKLLLNIEQYEYMEGPTEGAGLKILVHDQLDIPLVRNYGQAISPGKHAFVGINTYSIKALKHPYGQCDEKPLLFYKNYSWDACLLDCHTRYLNDRCQCRLPYMPANSGLPVVCTLWQYNSCAREAMDTFQQKDNDCICPVACSRTIYPPLITYASTSNFDMDKWIQKDIVTNLSRKFLNSREIAQRVISGIVASDTQNLNGLAESHHKLRNIFNVVDWQLTYMTECVIAMLDNIVPRIDFHMQRGLNYVKFKVHNDYTRGWQVMEERTVSHITGGYIQTMFVFEDMVHTLLKTPLSKTMERHVVYERANQELKMRKHILKLGQGNFTDAYNSFKGMGKITSYGLTPDKRYDSLYIPKRLLAHVVSRKTLFNMTKLNMLFNQYSSILDRLQIEALLLRQNNTVNETEMHALKTQFLKVLARINYYRFLFGDRIVKKAEDIVDQKILKFQALNSSFHSAASEIKLASNALKQSIVTVNETLGTVVSPVVDLAYRYLTDKQLRKSSVVKSMQKGKLDEALNQIQVFFSETRSRSRTLQDWLHKFGSNLYAIWENMAMESSLKKVYLRLHDDYVNMVFNRTLQKDLQYFFRRLLKMNETLFNRLSNEELQRYLNADISETNLLGKHAEIKDSVADILQKANIKDTLANIDEQFAVAFGKVRHSLDDFQQGSKVDTKFAKENFMRVDLYLQSLSYEEVEQQEAYTWTSLLNDLGGSLGLFIGASVLTIFEVMDLFINSFHHIHM